MIKLFWVLCVLVVFSCKVEKEVQSFESLIYSNNEIPLSEVNPGKWAKNRAEVIHEDVSYYSAQGLDNDKFKFDFYRPHGVTKKLPLVVFIHSGAFLTGSRKNTIITQYCKDLVRTGEFAAAVIDYRLIDISSAAATISKAYTRTMLMKSVGDARNAIKYFIDNDDKLNIDSDNLYVVGYSAGAIIANQLIFTDTNEAKDYIAAPKADYAISSIASLIGYNDVFAIDNQESFDYDIASHIKGVVSISGAVMSQKMLDDMDNINTSLLLIHGTEDRMVPIGNESPFNRLADEDLDIYIPNLSPASQLSILRKITIKKEVLEDIIDFVASPICGSRCIYEGVFNDSNIQLMEIQNAPHMFMIGEQGLLNETYTATRNKIYHFLKESR